jgi:hypothetical protein
MPSPSLEPRSSLLARDAGEKVSKVIDFYRSGIVEPGWTIDERFTSPVFGLRLRRFAARALKHMQT